MSNAEPSSIRDLRLSLSMTQEEFAHALGTTVSTVNRWENGHTRPSKLARTSLAGLSGRLEAATSESAALAS
jgi:putative transcriptional regulator